MGGCGEGSLLPVKVPFLIILSTYIYVCKSKNLGSTYERNYGVFVYEPGILNKSNYSQGTLTHRTHHYFIDDNSINKVTTNFIEFLPSAGHSFNAGETGQVNTITTPTAQEPDRGQSLETTCSRSLSLLRTPTLAILLCRCGDPEGWACGLLQGVGFQLKKHCYCTVLRCPCSDSCPQLHGFYTNSLNFLKLTTN